VITGALLILIAIGVPVLVFGYFEHRHTQLQLRGDCCAIDASCDESMRKISNAIEYSGVHVSGVVCRGCGRTGTRDLSRHAAATCSLCDAERVYQRMMIVSESRSVARDIAADKFDLGGGCADSGGCDRNKHAPPPTRVRVPHARAAVPCGHERSLSLVRLLPHA
jgi:hypothetical protein